jgi:hypothetical protein
MMTISFSVFHQEQAVALFPQNYEFVTRLAKYRELVAKERSESQRAPSKER